MIQLITFFITAPAEFAYKNAAPRRPLSHNIFRTKRLFFFSHSTANPAHKALKVFNRK